MNSPLMRRKVVASPVSVEMLAETMRARRQPKRVPAA